MLAHSSLRKKKLRRKSGISIDSSNMIYQYQPSNYHSLSTASSPSPRSKHVILKKKLRKVKSKRKKGNFLERKRSPRGPRCVDRNTSQDEISTKMFCSLPNYDRRTVNSAASSFVQNYYLDQTTPIKKIIDTQGYIDSEIDLLFPSVSKPKVSRAVFEQPRTLVTRPMKMSHFLNKMQKFQNILKVTGTEADRRLKYKEISTSVGPKIPSNFSAGSFARKYFFQDMAQPSMECDTSTKFPVLRNRELIKRFMSVTLTNNQKGRLRQVLRQIVCGPSPKVVPEVINNRIQTILRSSVNLTDTDLRKIRILYNMLQKAIAQEEEENKTKNTGNTEQPAEGKTEESTDKKDEKKEKKKRYTVFIGNLQKNVTKDDILQHFSDLQEYIKDVRIPRIENKKSAIAYLELSTEPSYEMALSKNHTMLNNRRINVMYTVSKNSKISKAEAKAKAAKLSAMVKNGTLTGSRPMNKKRSHRRAIMRQHRKNEEKALSQ